VSELNFALDYMESNPQFLQVARGSGRGGPDHYRFELNRDQRYDQPSAAPSYAGTHPEDLTHIRMFESLQQPDPRRIELLKEQVRAAVVPVEVELGQTTVTVGDLLDLAPGDVVVLDRKKHETLDVKIGSMTKFKGHQAGSVRAWEW